MTGTKRRGLAPDWITPIPGVVAMKNAFGEILPSQRCPGAHAEFQNSFEITSDHVDCMKRRSLLHSSGLAILGLAVESAFADGGKRPPRILLRSSWQTVNIGDIAHTPGVLSILRQHLPEEVVQLLSR